MTGAVKRGIRLYRIVMVLGLAMLGACDRFPGRPTEAERPLRPSQVTDFGRLYIENCAGCHGINGSFGAALPLANPVYLAVADDSVLTDAIANGIAGTPMPAFAISAGGMLTDDQIAILVNGIRTQWGANQQAGQGAPSYASTGAGDASNGAKLFGDYCATCHGAGGSGGTAGAVADPSLLALYNDQVLRTLIIAGRPDLGHPGWRDYPGKAPLSSAQVTDLVAWLSAQRRS